MKVIRFFWRKMVFLLTHYDIDFIYETIFFHYLKNCFRKIHPDFLQLRFRQHGLRHDDGIRRLSLV